VNEEDIVRVLAKLERTIYLAANEAVAKDIAAIAKERRRK
jgi:hypothetical protein